MLSEEQSTQETDRIMKLMRKYDPSEAKKIPEGDFYVRPSNQDAVWATLASGSLITVLWILLILLGSLDKELASWLMAIGTILTIAIAHPALVEWSVRDIRPVYGSMALGSVWVGQRTQPWMFRGGGSSPDTVQLQRQDIDTPELGWFGRTFFSHDQRVRLPSGKEVLLADEAVDFYRIRDYWLRVRNQSQKATMETRDFMEQISRYFTGPEGIRFTQTLRDLIREELQQALASVPRAVVAEFAKSFDVGAPTK